MSDLSHTDSIGSWCAGVIEQSPLPWALLPLPPHPCCPCQPPTRQLPCLLACRFARRKSAAGEAAKQPEQQPQKGGRGKQKDAPPAEKRPSLAAAVAAVVQYRRSTDGGTDADEGKRPTAQQQRHDHASASSDSDSDSGSDQAAPRRRRRSRDQQPEAEQAAQAQAQQRQQQQADDEAEDRPRVVAYSDSDSGAPPGAGSVERPACVSGAASSRAHGRAPSRHCLPQMWSLTSRPLSR